MNAARALCVFVLGAGLSLGLGSCSSGSTTAALEAEPLTVGDIYQLVLNSPGFDSDGDVPR